jgi:hypothetical protein
LIINILLLMYDEKKFSEHPIFVARWQCNSYRGSRWFYRCRYFHFRSLCIIVHSISLCGPWITLQSAMIIDDDPCSWMRASLNTTPFSPVSHFVTPLSRPTHPLATPSWRLSECDMFCHLLMHLWHRNRSLSALLSVSTFVYYLTGTVHIVPSVLSFWDATGRQRRFTARLNYQL